MASIINCTPHAVKIVDGAGALVKEFTPSGMTIRLSAKTVEIGGLEGVRLTSTTYGEPVLVTPVGEGALPEENASTYYLVSAMVRSALPHRGDLLVPAEQVRDDQGRIVGCKSLGV